MSEKRTSRRGFLGAVGAGAVLSATPRVLHAMEPAATGSLKIAPAQALHDVPADFTGLSYETAQLAHPDFFTASNAGLIAMCRTLGTRGVLRIGGNTSAFTRWDATDAPQSSGEGTVGADKGASSSQHPGMYVVTPTAIRNLDAFLRATGWRLIYGLNLRHGTPEDAAEEAAFVAKTCGHRLQALQFGNEPDLFRTDDGANGGKGTLWTFDDYLPKWKEMYKAVHQRLPHVEIGGPDAASKKEWVGRFADETKGEVQLLSSHYYAEGPPADPRMTIDYLMHASERLHNSVYQAIDIARTAGLPYRMSEGNSCYNGGKAGVSDTFAAALWSADFMLDLAARGVVGVNLHGGGSGPYTPIAGSSDTGYTARPVFYGMLLAGEFAGARMVQATLDSGGANATAYASRMHGKGLQAAVINKSDTKLTLDVTGAPSHGKARMWALRGSAIDSKTGVTFGGSEVQGNGSWSMGGGDPLQAGPLRVPAYSAVLVRWD